MGPRNRECGAAALGCPVASRGRLAHTFPLAWTDLDCTYIFPSHRIIIAPWMRDPFRPALRRDVLNPAVPTRA